jgi:hypothetical protein
MAVRKKSPLRVSRRRAFLILTFRPLLLTGTVRRHVRHEIMVVTMMVSADLHGCFQANRLSE